MGGAYGLEVGGAMEGVGRMKIPLNTLSKGEQLSVERCGGLSEKEIE